MNTRFVIPMLTLTAVMGATAAQAHATADTLDRMHVRVATTRDAEQQRWIAREVNLGRLNLPEAAALERAQAKIVSMQAGLERRGHESVDDALRMQHLQDVQDWAIREHSTFSEPRA